MGHRQRDAAPHAPLGERRVHVAASLCLVLRGDEEVVQPDVLLQGQAPLHLRVVLAHEAHEALLEEPLLVDARGRWTEHTQREIHLSGLEHRADVLVDGDHGVVRTSRGSSRSDRSRLSAWLMAG